MRQHPGSAMHVAGDWIKMQGFDAMEEFRTRRDLIRHPRRRRSAHSQRGAACVITARAEPRVRL
jgi:hypothetical protein